MWAGTVAPAVRRVVTIAIGLALLWFVIAITVAGIIGTQSGAALALAPWDAGARAARAQLTAASAGPAGRAEARADAVRALSRDPTVVAAVDALAIDAAARNKLEEADHAFAYAQQLSRRAPAAQLWFIEREVQRGDIRRALEHYDIALSTSLPTRRRLFPILFDASSSPEVAHALNGVLRQRPDWRGEFLSEFVGKVSDPMAIITVTHGVFSRTEMYDRAAFETALNRLTSDGNFMAALTLYADVRGRSAALARVRDPAFADSDPTYPFDWSLSDEAGLSPERGRRPAASTRTALMLPAAPSQDGVVARQLVRVLPGSRTLRVAAGDIAGPTQARPRLKVTCADASKAELAELLLPVSPERGLVSQKTFDVPASCSWAWITIGVRSHWGEDAVAAPWVADVDLR